MNLRSLKPHAACDMLHLGVLIKASRESTVLLFIEDRILRGMLIWQKTVIANLINRGWIRDSKDETGP